MRKTKLASIAIVRRIVLGLRATEHVKACTCCQDDLDLVDEDPATPWSADLLHAVQTRCQLAQQNGAV